MNRTKIIVRMSKSSGIYNKTNTYLLRLMGQGEHEMNFKNNRREFLVEPGKHTIEIGNEVSSQKVDVILRAGQTKILTINPSCTYYLGLGIMAGIVVTSIVIQIAILRKFSPLLIIPCVSFLFIKKSNFENSFVITQTISKH